MARIARIARRQIERFIDYYLEQDRAEAAQKLRSIVNQAQRRVDRRQMPVRGYPANYPELAVLGMSWIKIHIYWFGYRKGLDGKNAIGNVLWEGADLPSRVEPFDDSQ